MSEKKVVTSGQDARCSGVALQDLYRSQAPLRLSVWLVSHCSFVRLVGVRVGVASQKKIDKAYKAQRLTLERESRVVRHTKCKQNMVRA